MELITAITISLLAGLALGGYATRLRRQKNKDVAWNEARTYYRINNPFNPQIDMLLTSHGVAEAQRRARKQPEDLT